MEHYLIPLITESAKKANPHPDADFNIAQTYEQISEQPVKQRDHR